MNFTCSPLATGNTCVFCRNYEQRSQAFQSKQEALEEQMAVLQNESRDSKLLAGDFGSCLLVGLTQQSISSEHSCEQAAF